MKMVTDQAKNIASAFNRIIKNISKAEIILTCRKNISLGIRASSGEWPIPSNLMTSKNLKGTREDMDQLKIDNHN